MYAQRKTKQTLVPQVIKIKGYVTGKRGNIKENMNLGIP